MLTAKQAEARGEKDDMFGVFCKGDLVIKHIALMKRILFRELDMGCHLLEHSNSS